VNIAFQPTEITVPAGAPFTITFDNQDDGIQHNVEIFDNPDFSGEAIFAGSSRPDPPRSRTRCPRSSQAPIRSSASCIRTWSGRSRRSRAVVAVWRAGGCRCGAEHRVRHGHDRAAADTAATIAFDNLDAGVQHNVSIYEDETLASPLFQGELITGPAKTEYQIPPLPAGEYYFVCDVHPNMNGVVIVGGGGGEQPTATVAPSPGETMTDAATPAPNGDATVQVTAQGIAFDTAEIVLDADRRRPSRS